MDNSDSEHVYYSPKCIVILSRYQFFYTAKSCLQELYMTYIWSQLDIIPDIARLETPIMSQDISHTNIGRFSNLGSAFHPVFEEFTNKDNLSNIDMAKCGFTNDTTFDGKSTKSKSMSQRLSRCLEMMIVRLITRVEVPDPGMSAKFTISNSGELTHLIWRAPNTDLPKTMGSMDVYDFFRQLGINNALTVFEACLMETKILIISLSYSRLTSACSALEALIYPLKYSHVYIPLLPSSMLAIVEAPTPYIIGTHVDNLERVRSLIDLVLVVNLDVASVDFVHKEKTKNDRYCLCTLPGDLRDALSASVLHIFRTHANITNDIINNEDHNSDGKRRLKFQKRVLRPLNDELLTNTSLFSHHNSYSKQSLCSRDQEYSFSEERKHPWTDLVMNETNRAIGHDVSVDALLKSTFFQLFACIMRGYASHLILIRVWPKTALVLDKAKLLKQNHFDKDEFMQKFVSTMLFHKFIEERGLPTRRKDTFDALCDTSNTANSVTFTDIVKLFAQNEESPIESVHNNNLKYYINEVINNKQNIFVKSFPILDAERIENLITAKPPLTHVPCVVPINNNKNYQENMGLECYTYTISADPSNTIPASIPDLVQRTEKQLSSTSENIKVMSELTVGSTNATNLESARASDANFESKWVYLRRISILNLWLHNLLVIKDLYVCCQLLHAVTNILSSSAASANSWMYYQVIVRDVYNAFRHDTCTMLMGWQFFLLQCVLSRCLDVAENTGDITTASKLIKMSNSIFFKPCFDSDYSNNDFHEPCSNVLKQNSSSVNKRRVFMSDLLRPQLFARQQSFWLLSFYSDIQNQLMGLYSYKCDNTTSTNCIPLHLSDISVGSRKTVCTRPQELLHYIYQNPSKSVPEFLNNRDLGEVEEQSIFSLLISYIQNIINAWMSRVNSVSVNPLTSHNSQIIDGHVNRKVRRTRNFYEDCVLQSINEMRKFLIQFVDNVCSDTLISDKRKKEMHIKLDNIIQLESENLKYSHDVQSASASDQIEYLSGLKEHAQNTFEERKKICQSFLLKGEEIQSERCFCIITDYRLKLCDETSSSSIDLHPAHESQLTNPSVLPPFSGALFVTNLRLLGVGNQCLNFKTSCLVNFRLLSITLKRITSISAVNIFKTNSFRCYHEQNNMGNNLMHSTLFGNIDDILGSNMHWQIFDPYCHPEVIIKHDNGVSHIISFPYVLNASSDLDRTRFEIDQFIKPILMHINRFPRPISSPEYSCVDMSDIFIPLNSTSVRAKVLSSLDVLRSKVTTDENKSPYDNSSISYSVPSECSQSPQMIVSSSLTNASSKCSLSKCSLKKSTIGEVCPAGKFVNQITIANSMDMTTQQTTPFTSMTNVATSSMTVREIQSILSTQDSVSKHPTLIRPSCNAQDADVSRNKQLYNSANLGILTDYIRMNFNDGTGQIETNSFNENYTLCATYPRVVALIGVDSCINDHSTFIARTRLFKWNRFPVVVFRHPISKALILRSAKLLINNYKTNGRADINSIKNFAFGPGHQQLDTQSLIFDSSDSSPCYTYSEHSYAPSVCSLNSVLYEEVNSKCPLISNLTYQSMYAESGFHNDLPSSQTISSINSYIRSPEDSLRPFDASSNKSAMHFTRSISNSLNLKFCKRLVQSCERMNSLANMPVAAPVDSSMGSLSNDFLHNSKECLTNNLNVNQYSHCKQVVRNARTTLVVFDLRYQKIRRIFRSNQMSVITKCYRQMYPTMRMCFLAIDIQSAKDVYSTWTKLEEVIQFCHNQSENIDIPQNSQEHQFQFDRVSTPPEKFENSVDHLKESCNGNSKKSGIAFRHFFNVSGTDTVPKTDAHNKKGITKSESIKKQTRPLSNDPHSAWLFQINTLIQTAWQLQGHINDGTNILISLEDGDTVTSQLSALTQIITDPFYRTINGIMCLIQKEWFDLGCVTDNQNSLKMGATSSVNSRQNSVYGSQGVGSLFKKIRSSQNRKSKKSILPYIIQFLDAVHQILCKNPNAFAFNDFFLQTLCSLLYSGNFFQTQCGCEQEKIDFVHRLQDLGDYRRIGLRHVWNYIASVDKCLPVYRNFQYTSYCDVNVIPSGSADLQHDVPQVYTTANTIQDNPKSPFIHVDHHNLTCPSLCDLEFWLLYSYDLSSVIHSPLSDINYCSLLTNRYFQTIDEQSEPYTHNENTYSMDDDSKYVSNKCPTLHNKHVHWNQSGYRGSNLPLLIQHAWREMQMFDEVCQLAIIDEVLRSTLAKFNISKDNLPIMKAHMTSHGVLPLMGKNQVGKNLIGSNRDVLASQNRAYILPAKALMHDFKCVESSPLMTDCSNVSYRSLDWKQLGKRKDYREYLELSFHTDTGTLNPLSNHVINIERLPQSNSSERFPVQTFDPIKQNPENNTYNNSPTALNLSDSLVPYRYKIFSRNRSSYQLSSGQDINFSNKKPSAQAFSCTIAEAEESSCLCEAKQTSHYQNVLPELFDSKLRYVSGQVQMQDNFQQKHWKLRLMRLDYFSQTLQILMGDKADSSNRDLSPFPPILHSTHSSWRYITTTTQQESINNPPEIRTTQTTCEATKQEQISLIGLQTVTEYNGFPVQFFGHISEIPLNQCSFFVLGFARRQFWFAVKCKQEYDRWVKAIRPFCQRH